MAFLLLLYVTQSLSAEEIALLTTLRLLTAPSPGLRVKNFLFATPLGIFSGTSQSIL